MDLSSILSMTATAIQSVNDYATSVKDAPKSCEAFKDDLSSTQKLLEELQRLVEEDLGDVRFSSSNPSHLTELACDQDAVMRSLIDGGHLKKLQTTLVDILEWLRTQQSNPGKMALIRMVLWSSSAQRKRIEKFSSELEKFKSAATLALSIGLRYVF